jgi:hypothetical protein
VVPNPTLIIPIYSLSIFRISVGTIVDITLKENIEHIGYESFAYTPIETVFITIPSSFKRLQRDIFKETKIIEGKHVLNIEGVVFGYDLALQKSGIDVLIAEDVFMMAEDAFSNAVINTLRFEKDFIQTMKRAFQSSTIVSSFELPKSLSFEETFQNARFNGTFTLNVPLDANTYRNMFNSLNAVNVTFIFDALPESSDSRYLFYFANIGDVYLKSDVTYLQRAIFSYTSMKHLNVEARSLTLDYESMFVRTIGTYAFVSDFTFIPRSYYIFNDLRTVSTNFTNINGYITFGKVLVDSRDVSGSDLVILRYYDFISL